MKRSKIVPWTLETVKKIVTTQGELTFKSPFYVEIKEEKSLFVANIIHGKWKWEGTGATATLATKELQEKIVDDYLSSLLDMQRFPIEVVEWHTTTLGLNRLRDVEVAGRFNGQRFVCVDRHVHMNPINLPSTKIWPSDPKIILVAKFKRLPNGTIVGLPHSWKRLFRSTVEAQRYSSLLQPSSAI